MTENLVVIDGHALSINTFERILQIAKSRGVRLGGDFNPSSLEVVKTPLDTRIKKSKFNSLLEEMSDDQLKATAVALLFDTKVQAAVKMFHTSVANYAQVAAIAHQLNKRNIVVS